MNHEEAVRQMVAEKYLLDELSPELREKFEEHFFGCEDCAMDVRSGAALVEHSKIALAEVSLVGSQVITARSKPSGVWGWLRPSVLIPVMAVLLAVVAYQNLVSYPRLRDAIALATAPQILPSASLINVNTRGANRLVVVARRGQPFLLFVDVPAEARFNSYVAELLGPGGNSEWSLNIPADVTRDTLSIRVPSDAYATGTHTLVVRGLDAGSGSSEVGRYPFELQFQK